MAAAQTAAAGESGRKLILAAANELDNFVVITRDNLRGGPIRTRQDLQIALDRDAPGAKSKRFEKLQDSGAICGGLRFPVHYNRDCSGRFHGFRDFVQDFGLARS